MLRFLATTLIGAMLGSSPAFSCIAAFGYTGSSVAEIDYLTANVDVGMAHIIPANENDYIVDDVQYLVQKAGPVLVDLTDLIFSPNQVTVGCGHYERGNMNETVQYTNLRGSYQARLDTFFMINAALFQGTRKVYGLIIQNEANNRCVEGWKMQTATSYVETKLAAVAQYGPIYTIAGYGLRNTPLIEGRGPIVSKGFPVSSGAIAKFPSLVDVIAYYVYDIYDPSYAMHPLNVNAESWTTLNDKLNQALNTGQKTLVVIKAFCNNTDPIEAAWDVTCPGQAVWKIGQVATNWTSYLRSDPRNLFVVAFGWPDFTGTYGSKSLSQVWPFHSGVQQSVNCSVP